MLPTDLELARLCAASENPSQNPSAGFDFIDTGAETGVWVAIKKLPDVDVIVFRGSETTEDWLRDLEASMTPDGALGMVHEGFSKNLDAVHALLDQHTRPNPVITGHSLGAARACIYTGMLVNYFDDPAKVAIFGCPRPGSQSLADFIAHIPLKSYKNRHDPVTDVPFPLPPRLLYAHVAPFVHVDGLVDLSLPEPLVDHHIANYVAGLEKII